MRGLRGGRRGVAVAPGVVLLTSAVGDGVTDDTAAITADFAARTLVKLKPGSTYLTGQIVVPAGKVLDVDGATFKQMGGSANPAIRADASSSIIGRGTVDCSLGSNSGIVVQGDDVFIDERVTVLNATLKGVACINYARTRAGCTVTAPGEEGLYFVNNSGADLDGPDLTGARVDLSAQAAGAAFVGIKVYGGPTNGWKRPTVVGAIAKMKVASTASIGIELTRCTDPVVGLNQTDGGWMGLSLATCTGVSVAPNAIRRPTKYGVEVVDSTGVIGPQAIDMGGSGTSQVGMAVDGNALTISAPRIVNLSATGTPVGISFSATSSDITLTGPEIEIPASATGIGISFVVGATAIVVSGHQIKGAGGTPFAGIQNDGCTNITVGDDGLISGFQNDLYAGGAGTFNGRTQVGRLATDIAITNTAGYDTIKAVTFTPSTSRALVVVNGTGYEDSASTSVKFQVVSSSGSTQSLGAEAPTQNKQFAFGGVCLFTGLTPGTAYTFTVQARVSAGTFGCRAATAPDTEACNIAAMSA